MAPDSHFSMATLEMLRERHPAWRLLCSTNAPFVVAFLHRIFIAEQRRQVPEGELLRRLEDHLFAIRSAAEAGSPSREAKAYIAEWSSDARGWIRVSYRPGADEPVYDLTPQAERALDFLASLQQRTFVGTESRLLTIIELLRQIRDGTERDPGARIRELEQRKAAIEQDIERARSGDIPQLTDVEVRDRYEHVAMNARSLLSDLREVEQNFRHLDREARARIAQWDGGKGELLSGILGDRDAIIDSDQGRSFGAFWDFLMSPDRQDEFDRLLMSVLAVPTVGQAASDTRMPRVRFDWLEAGDQAQLTVARLSEQLRRFIDDRAARENRRIVQLVRDVERAAAALRDAPPDGDVMVIDAVVPEIILPFDRPLYRPPMKESLSNETVAIGVSEADAGALYDQVYIDPAVLAERVGHCLIEASEVPLTEVLRRHPLEEGLAELVGYVRLATNEGGLVRAVVDEEHRDLVEWIGHDQRQRQATLPRILFRR